jgi:hypothetical protein
MGAPGLAFETWDPATDPKWKTRFPAHSAKNAYSEAIAEASSRCRAAYFVIPTIVNTF